MDTSNKRFYNLNHIGSISEVTDSSGSVLGQFAYSLFGQPSELLGSYVPDFGFAGYYLHSRSGLNLSRTRAYSASLGRFINRDPIEEEGGINLYEYVTNNPVSFSDPFGLQTNCDPCQGKSGWALYICKRDNDPCKEKWGIFLKLCRKFHPGSTPIPPTIPPNETIPQLIQDGAPWDVIQNEIVARGQANHESYEQILNDIQQAEQWLENLKQQQIDAQNRANRLPPVQTIINH